MAKAKKKPKAQAVHSEMPPPEREQHGPVYMQYIRERRGKVESGSISNRATAFAEPMDDPLYRRRCNKTLTRAQYDAGLLLRALAQDARSTPSIVSGYAEKGSGKGNNEMLIVRSDEKWRKLGAAIMKIGRANANATVTVCIHQEDIRPARVGELKAGLDSLVRFFQT